MKTFQQQYVENYLCKTVLKWVKGDYFEDIGILPSHISPP